MLAPSENARNTTITALRMRPPSRHKVPQPARLFGTAILPAVKRIVIGRRRTQASEALTLAAVA